MDLARCFPILASLNISESEAFYTDKLGFERIHVDDAYLIVRRDEMELHFWLTDNRKFPESTACYIRGGQIENLYQDFKETGVPGLSDFSVRPWQMKEFYIKDPHGNLLKFGMIPEEALDA